MFRSVLVCAALFSVMCTSNPTESLIQKSASETSTETYIYQDVAYEVKFIVSDGVKTAIENETSLKVQKLLENPNCGICPDPKNDSVVHLYFNNTELEAITEKITGRSTLAKKAGNHDALLVGCISLGCPNWNEEHWSWTAETDGCLETPWNNALSELFWLGGDDGLDHAVCFEKCGEDRGRSIVVWCATNVSVNLRSHCMKRCLWWCCTTWNDQISLIDIWDL